ncbi:hypothetical protein ACQ4PT_027896 [Festuca glaucescens]
MRISLSGEQPLSTGSHVVNSDMNSGAYCAGSGESGMARGYVVQISMRPGSLRLGARAPGVPSPQVFATHGHRRRRERGVHAPLVLLCSIGAIVFLANARHVLFPKESFLGSFWSTTTNKPQGVKYELHTLPVDAKDVADGDTMTVYVDMPNPHESGNVPREVQEAVVERIKARAAKNYQKADTLQKIIVDAGYRQVPNLSGEQVLAKKYRIRLRGIDAPENSMPYGKEAKEELVKLVQGRTLKISVYDTDRYGRLVGDVECNGVFVQEHMLKKGLAWHYTAYDRRQELAKWESQTRASRLGLWALPNPEKPWEWRKDKRMRKW